MRKYFHIVGWGFIASLLFAAESQALNVLPGYQILSIQPGATAYVQVTLTNNEDKDLDILPGSKDWFVYPANEAYKAEDWLVVQESEFKLKKDEVKQVTYKVTAPENAVGELVGMATFLTQGSPIRMKMSVAVYAVMKGTEEYDYEIVDVGLSQKPGRLSGIVEVENKGNVHMRIGGIIKVFNKKKKRVANIRIPSSQPVYPGKVTEVRGSISDFNLSRGRYYLETSLMDIDRQVRLKTFKKKVKLKKMRNKKKK